MNYRKFGSLGEVSALGFGCMRLPVNADGSINEPEAISMIRTAIDEGVDYVDTAYGYHDGKSEVVTGLALRDGYRQKVKLATKLPVWHVHEESDFDRLLNEQLSKLGVDHIDFYLLHALNKGSFNDKVLKFNLLDKMEKAKKDGKISHIGFSFHDDYEGFHTILNGYDRWEFCQIQFNYMDINNQAGLKGLKEAAEKGLGIIIMEPLLGGKLTKLVKQANELLTKQNPARDSVEWALDWIWNFPEVSTILSGMSTMQQVKDNLIYASRSFPTMLSEEDLNTMDEVRNVINGIQSIPCTKCRYCMPCPNGLDIPRNFDIYNESFKYDDSSFAKGSYNWFKNEDGGKKIAKNCTQCKACEANCPQQLEISALMEKVATRFAD